MIRILSKNTLALAILVGGLLICLPEWAAGQNFITDITITNSNPDINFIDNTASETDWEICVDDGCPSAGPNEGFNVVWNDGGSSFRPFTIETATGNNLLYLDAAERIGIKTNAPTHDLHVNGGQVRLQSGTAGNWVLNPGGTGLFFRNEDGSTTIPVQFHNNSPSNSFVIDTSGEIGLGTSTPSKKLHVRGSDSANLSDNTITARIENTTATLGSRHMLQLVNRGNPLLWFHNTQNDIRWSMNPIDTSFVFSRGGSGGYEMQLYSNGNLVIRGTLTQNSDRNTKKNIEAVNPINVLDKVAALPVSTWQFKNDTEKSRHLGPMAQDFYAAFGLGRDEKGIAPGDMSGVALAAIKGLYAQGKKKDAKIAKLETIAKEKDTKISKLEGKVGNLEKKLQAQQDHLAKLSALKSVVKTLVEKLNAQGPMQVSLDTTTPVGNHSF